MKIARLFPLPASLWICPFRPFFLLTAGHAVLAMAYWLGALAGVFPIPPVSGGPYVWHAHEMIFGFATAAIAGFLLTVIVEFTGCEPAGRKFLFRLLAVWFGGRIAYALSGWIGVVPAALCDIGFFFLLLVQIGGPLWRGSNRRHVAFFHTVLALAVAHAGFYVALYRNTDAMAWLLIAVGLLMILVIVAMSRISTRLVNDVLESQEGETVPYMARPPRRNLAIFAIGLCTAAEFCMPASMERGWLALAASAAVFNLLNDWHVGRALFQRWVFISYLIYWAMALGYAIIGVGLLAGENWSSAGHHLLLVGALGLSIFIVMAIAGRMHSGHGLDPRPWVILGATVIVVAALIRALAGIPALAWSYQTQLFVASALWIAGWGLYLHRSWGVLSGPRPDNLKGCDERH